MGPARSAILAVGHKLGDVIRGNDDPIFNWLKENPPPNTDLFQGLKYRRVLSADQTLTSIMVDAANIALTTAGLTVSDIDLLIGSGSVSDYSAPNSLAGVHKTLGLPSTCRMIALNSEYTIFLDALKIANDMIACGTIGKALVVCGINWTQHMDYHEAVSVAASDAAGAAVVGAPAQTGLFQYVDWENETASQYLGAMHMGPNQVSVPGPLPVPPYYTLPLMTLEAGPGREAILNFGIPAPIRVVGNLLARNQLSASNITLVPHQTSPTIATQWQEKIAPSVYVSTLPELADMVSASVPVNLSINFDQIPTDHLVLMGIGMEMHVTALLYSRTLPIPATS